MSATGDVPTRSAVAVRGAVQWRQIVSEQLMPLWIDTLDDPLFEASVVAGSFDGVRMFTIRAGPHVAERTERLARTGDPHYWLVFQLDGESVVEQSGTRSVLSPGDFAVYDSTLPYRRTFPVESRTLVLLFPQQLIPLPPHALASVAGVRIGPEDPMGGILGALLEGIDRNLPRLDDEAGRSTVQALVTLVVGALAAKIGARTPSSPRWEQLLHIRDWIMSNLDDPALSPPIIAAAHFVSVRHLHALFHDHGTTVSTWLRERRLEMARRDLETHGTELSIREIALRSGFTDSAWFARAFREAYGMSPSAYRTARGKNSGLANRTD